VRGGTNNDPWRLRLRSSADLSTSLESSASATMRQQQRGMPEPFASDVAPPARPQLRGETSLTRFGSTGKSGDGQL